MVIFSMWISTSVFLIASTWVVNIEAQELGQCYYPSKTWANDSRPCDPHAITTLCCPVGWTCFSNYACVVTDLTVVGSSFPLGTTIRGSCTNPLWNDGFCGGFCLNDNNGTLNNCGGGKWCCASEAADGTCNCSTGKGTFSIPQGVAQTIIGVSSLVSTNTAAASSTSATAKTISTGGSTLTTITSSASKSASSSGTSKTAATETAPTTNSTGNSTAEHKPITDTVAFKAGISVGAVAIAAVLGFLAFCLCYKKRPDNAARFPSRPSSPAYTAVTEPYNSGGGAQTHYAPFDEGSAYASPAPMRDVDRSYHSSTYGSPLSVRDPEPSSYPSQQPPLRDPNLEEHERPVSPQYMEHMPSMASLPRDHGP